MDNSKELEYRLDYAIELLKQSELYTKHRLFCSYMWSFGKISCSCGLDNWCESVATEIFGG